MLELFDEEVVNWVNEQSNKYAVTFDEAYALCVITRYNYSKSEEMIQMLDKTRNIGFVLRTYYWS
jgi:hypothetical protein